MATNKKNRRDPRKVTLQKLGARVRDLRHGKGWTQENLASSLDLSVAYVSLIERGGRNPPFTTVVAIASALGVPAREMFDA